MKVLLENGADPGDKEALKMAANQGMVGRYGVVTIKLTGNWAAILAISDQPNARYNGTDLLVYC